MTKTLLLAAALTALPLSLPADASRLTQLLPADTDLFLVVEDVPRLRAAAEESPLLQAWDDPAIAAWLAPLRERFDWDKINADARAQTGASPEEVLEWIEGGAVLAVRDFGSMSSVDEGPPPFVMVIEFGDNSDRVGTFLQERADRKVAENGQQKEEEEYGGVTVHSLYSPSNDEADDEGDGEDFAEEETYDEGDGSDEEAEDEAGDTDMHWALEDGLLLMSPYKDEVLAVLDALQDGAAGDSLATSAAYVELQEVAGEADLRVNLRLSRLVAMMEQGLSAATESGAGNPMIPPARNVIQGLGLDAWENAWFSLHLDGAESIAQYGLSYREARGLLTLLQTTQPSLPRPEWIPAHWKNVATYRFDMAQLLPRLQQIITDVSPPLGGMLQGMLAQMPQKTGVDLQAQLLSRFGDEVVAAQRFEAVKLGATVEGSPMEEVPQLLAFSLQDRAGVEEAVNKLWASGGEGLAQFLTTREYLGHRLTTFNPPAAPSPDGAPAQKNQPFHYAFTDQYLLVGIGSASSVEEALQAQSQRGASFWQRDDVEEALEWAPAHASMFQVQDLASVINVLVPTLENTLAAARRSAEEEAREIAMEEGEDPEAAAAAARAEAGWTNPDAVPPASVFAKYFGTSWGFLVVEPKQLRGVSRTLSPKP